MVELRELGTILRVTLRSCSRDAAAVRWRDISTPGATLNFTKFDRSASFMPACNTPKTKGGARISA